MNLKSSHVAVRQLNRTFKGWSYPQSCDKTAKMRGMTCFYFVVLSYRDLLFMWWMFLTFTTIFRAQLNHGVRRNFSRGGNMEILLILFRSLTVQCKWTFTKRFTVFTPLVCIGWTSIFNLFSEMFSTLRLSEMSFPFMVFLSQMFFFHKLPNIHFFEHFLQISHNVRIKSTAKTAWAV